MGVGQKPILNLGGMKIHQPFWASPSPTGLTEVQRANEVPSLLQGRSGLLLHSQLRRQGQLDQNHGAGGFFLGGVDAWNGLQLVTVAWFLARQGALDAPA